MPRIARAALVLALVLPAGLSLAADPPAPPAPAAPSPYGDTYTPAELAALDRALHAGNMTREDLTFRKDMARGHACLDVVREMLRDPLMIAPKIDELVNSLDYETYVTPETRASPRLPGIEAYIALITAASLLRWYPDERTLHETIADTYVELLSRLLSLGLPQEPERALVVLEDLASLPASPFSDKEFHQVPEGVRERVLRRKLPDEMLMREVFPSPFDAAVEAEIEAFLKDGSPDAVARLAAEMHPAEGELQPSSIRTWGRAAGSLLGAAEWLPTAFPTDAPIVRETTHGRVALGTLKDDVYTGDFSVIVDPGGNDRYEKGRFGAAFGTPNRRVGLLLDMGGDDVYACGDVDCTLGAAILGVAALFDLGQGNDLYEGGHLSLGAAVGGIGLLYDDGGSDVYEGKTFTQGAAGYGIGLLYDDSRQAAPALKTDEETKDPIAIAAWDNDRLSAWCTAQGFSRTLGVGLCVNARGNEVYEAGGVYLHAPLFSDRYQSFSQGFSIGAREHDMAGGVAALIDRAGNDRYLGDIYNQGVGYWYAAGLLYDGGGNDLYEMTQYGQGSGIHLAVGGLVDVSGSDAYVMHSGLGQGGSHDFAASVLHDRGGNDRYDGNTSCNGTGLTNSVGLFFERAGDDTYAAKRDGGFNAGRPARGFGSVGVFVDLAGKDDYLGPAARGGAQDDALWRGSDLGLGLDLASQAPTPGTPGASTPAADPPPGKVEIPAICRYEGPLTQEVFDQLWAIAVRWEVGDNRAIVPEARKRLIAFGNNVAPMLDAKLEKDESGLELRAFVDVLAGLRKNEGGEEAVLDLLRRNAAPEATERRRRVGLHLIGELKVTALEGSVVELLKGEDGTLARRAAGVLALLGSQAGNETLLAWVQPDGDERKVLAALGTLLGTGAAVYPRVRPLLDHRLVTVRTRLATLLADKQAVYGPEVLADLQAEDLSPRAVRTLLDAVARAPIAPTDENHVRSLVAHADWGVRADVARVLRAWQTLAEGAGGSKVASVYATQLATLQQDADLFVRQTATPEPKTPASGSVPAR